MKIYTKLIVFTVFILLSNIAIYAAYISSSGSTCIGTSGVTVTYSVVGYTNPQNFRWALNMNNAQTASDPSGSTFKVFFPATMANLTTGTLSVTTSEGSLSIPLTVYRPLGAIGSISGNSSINTPVTKEYSIPIIENASSYQWVKPDGTTIVSQSGRSIVLNFPSTYTSGTLRVQGINGPCGATAMATLSITGQSVSFPVAPTAAANQSFCGSALVSNLSATVPSGCNLVWYTASSGGTALSSSSALSSGTYYAESYNPTTGLRSNTRTAVLVAVNPIPTITGTTPGAVCGQGSVTLASSASSGTVNWYSVAGLLLAQGASYTTPVINTTTTYYVDATANGCTSPARTPVIATVNTMPTIASTTPASKVGPGSVRLEATASSGIITWYSAGGTELVQASNFDTPLLTATTTYYVGVATSTCSNPARTAVVATIIPSTGTLSGDGDICVGTTGAVRKYTAESFVSPQYYNWIVTAPGATPTSATTIYNPTSDGFMAYTSSNTIDISFPANISVATGTVLINTAEGEVSKSLTFYKPASKPTDISGPTVIYTNVPADLTNRIYSVAPSQESTINYIWTPPAGATMSANKNEATVTFSSSFTGGIIRVIKTNGPCGWTGEASTLEISAQLATLPPTPPLPPPPTTYIPFDQLPDPKTRNLTDKPVGFVSGSVNVGSGSASYTISIETPPGTAGMQPSVSVFYNSSAGIGLLGLGWDLSSTSAITRTGHNYYNDGKTEGINFNYTDKLSLDGNRLIVASGTYFNTNAVYRTEFETFSKITDKGGYFTVETKDGRTLEYGKTEDSRIPANGMNSLIKWCLNKVSDKFGNYIKYNYFRNDFTGEAWLSSIEYTGNEAGSLAPYNKIEFNYTTKSDPQVSYIKGAIFTNSVVLQSIKTYSESTLVKEYQFNYTLLEGTRLAEVIEKASDGSDYNSTVINWPPKKTTLSGAVPSNFTPLSHSSDEVYGDFNGDGRRDLVKLVDGNWILYLADQVGYNFTRKATGVYSTDNKELQVADFNGDGLDDLLEQFKISETSYSFTPWFSTGTGFNRNEAGKFTFNKANEIALGDFNGDGLMDCFIKELDINKDQKDWKIFSCTGTGRNIFQEINSGNNFPYKKDEICYTPVYRADGSIAYYRNIPCYRLYSELNKIFIDYDGDGRTDLMSMDEEKATFYKFNGTYFIKAFSTTDLNSTFAISAIGNLNGDGNIDLLVKNSSDQYKIINTTGAGVVVKDISLSGGFNETGDFNGDGLMDIMYVTREGTPFYYYVYFNNGNGFDEPVKMATVIGYSYISEIGDFNGDRIDDIYFYTSSTQQNQMVFLNTIENKFVNRITNGLGQKTEFVYKPLTDNTVYSKNAGSAFPIMEYQGPMYVVSSVKSDNGLGGQSEIRYNYFGMKVHRQGRGSLGFRRVSQTNVTAGIATDSYYWYNDEFYFPYLLNSETFTTSGTQISTTEYTVGVKDFGNKSLFTYNREVVSNDLLHNVTQTSAFEYDNYGNQTSAITDHSGAGTTTVTNTFVNGGSWCPAKPETSVVTKVIGSEAPFVSSTKYSYNTNGQVASVLTAASDPGTDDKKTTTTYEYNNPFGLTTKVITAGDDVATTPYILYEYDSKGRFLTKTTNALSQSSEATYDGKTGNVLTSKDINGLQTSYEYDVFGRPNKTTMPDGNVVTSTLGWADAAAPSNAVYYSLSIASGSNPVKIYYDLLGRSLRQVNKGFNGSDIYSDSKYNAKGQLYQVSDPYFSAGTPEWTTYSYDAFGRSTSIAAPTGNVTVAYSGLTTTTTNTSAVPQQSSSKTMNALGLLASATDAGGTITYTYFSSGQPKTITSPGNAVTIMEYDEYGNQTKLIEPNAGTVTYTYNAFHQLVSQVKNGLAAKTSALTYDVLGRVKTLTENEGTTTYTYDTKNYGKGKLASVTAPGSVSEDYTFDNLGRLSSKTETIDGQNFTESLTYDTYSRLSTLAYPSGFAVSYNYNSNNYLYEIKRTDDNSAVWTAQTMNARGQIEQFKSGNNLVTTQTFDHGFVTGIKTGTVQNFQYNWDKATGNLTWRKDASRSLTENFTYDNLDRLTSAAIAGGATVNFTFNNNGNVATSTPAGIYTYDAAKPHAVATVTNPNGIVPTTQQSVKYTSFDKVKEITEGTKTLTIAYGTNKERKKMVITEGTTTLTRYYAHGNYEKETGSVVREMHYISGSTGVAAIYEKKSSGNGNQMYYIHKDHQGSVNVITNQSGALVEEMNFDAWGRRRNPANWAYTGVATTHVTNRGYTGHEHLDQFGIINMNGRVYDPVLGRFLSPDMVVQAPGYTQSYNRYSYCFNNPLKYTDPSGWYGENSNNSSGEGYGPDGVKYDPTSSTGYRDKNGNEVSWDEVYNSIHKNGGVDLTMDGQQATALFDLFTADNAFIASQPDPNGWMSVAYERKGKGAVITMHASLFVLAKNRMFPQAESSVAAGGGANAWDYISNGASVASGYPTISGTWAYNTSGDVAWTGKNGNYYKLSQVKNNGGYVKSMNYAKNASRLTRGLGNGLTGLSIVTSIVSVGVNLYNDTHNTSVWVGAAIGIGTGILTFVAAPVIVTGAAIVGTAWGVGQLVGGDEINGWIDDNFGYR